MEYVIVKYSGKRKVFIDEHEAGFTNETLWVDEGTHIITLGEPVDYTPPSVQRDVTGTNALKPMEVTFAKLP